MLLSHEQWQALEAAAGHLVHATGEDLKYCVELVLAQPATLGKIANDLRATGAMLGYGPETSLVAAGLDDLQADIEQAQASGMLPGYADGSSSSSSSARPAK